MTEEPQAGESQESLLENDVRRPILDTHAALSSETDRGCVLIVTEWLNDRLNRLLTTKFTVEHVPRKDQHRLLSSFGAPLFTFGVRINICRAFGLISPSDAEALHSLREIRNHCAHHQGLVSLADGFIEPRIKVLAKYISKTDGSPISDRELIESAWGLLSARILEHEMDIMRREVADLEEGLRRRVVVNCRTAASKPESNEWIALAINHPFKWAFQKLESLMSWDHSGVFNALADRFGTNESVTNPLTWLYAQQPDCAVLYADWAVFKNHPLHINPGRSSWLPATYKAILPAIELVKLETKIDKYRYDRFLCFEIVDWDAFAAGLRLDD